MSLTKKPGRTSTGCPSPRGAIISSGEAVSENPSSHSARYSVSQSSFEGGRSLFCRSPASPAKSQWALVMRKIVLRRRYSRPSPLQTVVRNRTFRQAGRRVLLSSHRVDGLAAVDDEGFTGHERASARGQQQQRSGEVAQIADTALRD